MPTASADYGVDAPTVPLFIGIGGLALLVIGGASLATGRATGVGFVIAALALFGQASLFLHTTRRGKFAVWNDILDGLSLRGDEQVLDMGCGRGAVLLAAAKRLPAGHATGVDLWRSIDQSGNSLDATQANAEAESVAGRVDLATGDMTDLPLPDGRYDLVLSSLAIHNIKDAAGRAQAIDQAVRVLKPGGRLVIADIQKSQEYAARLRHLGLTNVERKPLGWRFWFGGPWMATSLVTATKPT